MNRWIKIVLVACLIYGVAGTSFASEGKMLLEPELTPEEYMKLGTAGKFKFLEKFIKAKDKKRREIRDSYMDATKEQQNAAIEQYLDDLRVTCEWLRQLDDKLAKDKVRQLYSEVYQHEQRTKLAQQKERESKRQKHTLRTPRVTAKKFKNLTAQEKSDILCDIAEASLKELLAVPAQGLKESESSLRNIIERRKWLEKTDDVVARLLALRLQKLVDLAVVEAIVHSEKQVLELKTKVGYKPGTLKDKNVVKRLLMANQLNEKEYLDYALSLNTKAANLCRELNYTSKDFLSGKVLKEIPDELKIHVAGSFTWRGVPEDFDEEMEMGGVEGALVFYPVYFNSIQNVSEIILPLTLSAIGESNTLRLMAKVFDKYGKLLDQEQVQQAKSAAKERKPHDAWKWLYQEMKSESSESDRKLFNVGETITDKDGLAIYASKLYYDEIFEPGDGSELKYGGAPQMNLSFFIRDYSLLTERGLYGSRKLISKGLLGYWLELYEE